MGIEIAAGLMRDMESICRRDCSVAGFIALPFGRAISGGWRSESVVRKRKDHRAEGRDFLTPP